MIASSKSHYIRFMCFFHYALPLEWLITFHQYVKLYNFGIVNLGDHLFVYAGRNLLVT